MTAAFTKLKTHFANWREWEFNPIVIKELRQGVRSWTVTGMLLLFLVVLLLTSLALLIAESFDAGNLEMGGKMFSAFVVILAGASAFFIPLYTGVRVAAERVENNHDLLYVSTLSPARIIWGKFLCSAYIVLLFFSACMPFMAFTNLLRGVDLPTVFFILAFLFLVVCAINMVAIFLACLPLSRPFKFLFVIYGIFQSFGVIGSLVAACFEFMQTGVGAKLSEGNFWIGVLTALLLGLAVTGLFFVLAVALITPPSANRAWPVRIYLTGFWLLGGGAALFWGVQTGEADRLLAWAYPTLVIMLLALLVTISNSDALSLRVRRTIPASAVKRFFAFFFFNGAAGGLAWVAAILAVTYGTASAIISALPTKGIGSASPSVGITSLTIAAYAFDYTLTGLFIQRKFLPRRPPKLAGLLAILLAGGWAIAPVIILFFVNQLSWRSVEGLQLGNVFNVFSARDDHQLMAHLFFACGWLGLAVALNGKWFVQQVRNFRPPQPAAQAVPPPLPTQEISR